MHKLFRRSAAGLAILVAFCSLAGPAQAQLEDNLSAYGEANALLYLEPLKDALGAGLSDGLFGSGGVPLGESIRARLSIQGMLIRFGDEDKVFDPVTPDGFPGEFDVEVPTVVGSEDGASYTDSGSGATFLFPGGLAIDNLGLAVPQLTVGTQGFEGSIRYIGIETGDNEIGDISFFGIGGRADVGRFLGDLPVDISAMLFYQKLKFGTDLLEARALSFGVQASRRFSVIEPYAGLGFDRFGLDVEYTDASDVSIAASFEDETNPHLTLGSALHLGPVHINGELNFSNQFSIAFGLGLGL